MPYAVRRPKFRLQTALFSPLILQTVAAVGVVGYLVVSKSSVAADPNFNTRYILWLSVGALGLAIAHSLLVARWVTQQIRGMSTAAAAIAQGDSDQPLASSPLIDVDHLATSFNRMAEERRRSAAALRDSEERIRGLMTNISGAIYRCQCDSDWTMEYISDAIEAIAGYSASDFIQNRVRPFASIIHPDDRALVDEIVRHAVAAREPFTLDFRLVHCDGSTRWVYEQGQAIFGPDGDLLCLDGAIFDITDRKAAEDALKQSEAANRAMVSAIPDLLLRISSDGTCQGFSIGSASNARNEDQFQVGVSIYELIPFERAEERMYYLRQALNTGELQIYEQEIEIEGQIYYEEARVMPLSDDEVLVMVRDMTQRKKSEEAMERQLAAIEATISGIAILNSEGLIIHTNSAYANLYGYDNPRELIGQKWRSLYDSDELNRFEHEIMPRFFQDGQWSGEAIGKRRDGTTYQQEVSLTLMHDGGLVCVVQDISDRKRAEEALRIAEENYRSIFENALEGIFQSSPEGQFIRVNPALAKIYGYDSPDEMLESIVNIGEQLYVDPEKRVEFRDLLAKQSIVKEFKYRCYCKDKSIIWTQIDARVVKDSSGNTLYYEGIVQDITERKRREDELRQQLEKLRIEIDQKKREIEVATLTESTFFQEVRQNLSEVNLDEFWS